MNSNRMQLGKKEVSGVAEKVQLEQGENSLYLNE